MPDVLAAADEPDDEPTRAYALHLPGIPLSADIVPSPTSDTAAHLVIGVPGLSIAIPLSLLEIRRLGSTITNITEATHHDPPRRLPHRPALPPTPWATPATSWPDANLRIGWDWLSADDHRNRRDEPGL